MSRRTAVLSGGDFHGLRRRPRLELSVGCFVGERTGRTTDCERGAERALCSGSRRGFGRHCTAGRIAAYDTTTGEDRPGLRALAGYWWAPFEDTKDGRRNQAPTSHRNPSTRR
jgi:hypothetical protein